MIGGKSMNDEKDEEEGRLCSRDGKCRLHRLSFELIRTTR